MGGGIWLAGTVPAFARYEELKVSSSYIENSDIAILNIKNTGSAEATIDTLHVNGRGPDGIGWSATSTQLKSGDEAKITLTNVRRSKRAWWRSYDPEIAFLIPHGSLKNYPIQRKVLIIIKPDAR